MSGGKFGEETAKILVTEGSREVLIAGSQREDASFRSCGNRMAEGILMAGAWFTVRLICLKSYESIKSYRRHIKSYRRHIKSKSEAAAGAIGKNPIPWDPKYEADGPPTPYPNDDKFEELRAAASAGSRDNRKIWEEIRHVGHAVNNLMRRGLSNKLETATKMVVEYHVTHKASLLDDAHGQAILVNKSDESLVLALSALRLRISIEYLRALAADGEGSQNKREAKEGCEGLIESTLGACPPKTLHDTCRTFLSSWYSADKQPDEEAGQETREAFDIILEVMSSVYTLEPFEASEGPLPKKGVPDVVLHALAAYCESGQGSSPIYKDVVGALKTWQSKDERQEELALLSLYASTNGAGWACNKGWDGLFGGALSSLFGVSLSKEGRVTKISLGSNDLSGRLPRHLEKLRQLEELALPGNKLVGEVPPGVWGLRHLKVVALQDNSISVTPGGSGFRPARRTATSSEGDATGGTYEEAPRQRRGLAATVKACHSGNMYVCPGEVFMCSWTVVNTGDVTFPEGTKLAKATGNNQIGIDGQNEVMVNLLKPGEKQVVSVMQRAPNDGTYVTEEWTLVGHKPSLDFEGDQVKATSRIVIQDKYDDDVDSEKSAGEGGNALSPKNTVVLVRY